MGSIRLVVVEDDRFEADLAISEVLREGYDVEPVILETEEELVRALAAPPDVVLTDNVMPRLDAGSVLSTVQRVAPGVPVVILSGNMSQELAVKALHAGAADFISKDRMRELGPAVRRAIERARLAADAPRVRRRMEESEARFDLFMDNLDVVFWMTDDPFTRILYLSPAFDDVFGVSREAVLQDLHVVISLIHPDDIGRLFASDQEEVTAPTRARILRPDGIRWVESRHFGAVGAAGGPRLRGGFTRDVTAEVEAQQRLEESYAVLRRTDHERRLLLRHLVSAQEDERARISRDVHDDPIQVMTAVGIKVHILRGTVPARFAEGLREAEEAVEGAIGRLRSLMYDLRPAGLEQEAIADTFRAYLKETIGDPAITWDVWDATTETLSPEVRGVVYRIFQEAVINITKHARASSIQVEVASADDGVLLTVVDDGVGFDTQDERGVKHLGLLAMRERADVAGGSCVVTSLVGEGTAVTCWLPDRRAVSASEVA